MVLWRWRPHCHRRQNCNSYRVASVCSESSSWHFLDLSSKQCKEGASHILGKFQSFLDHVLPSGEAFFNEISHFNDTVLFLEPM